MYANREMKSEKTQNQIVPIALKNRQHEQQQYHIIQVAMILFYYVYSSAFPNESDAA